MTDQITEAIQKELNKKKLNVQFHPLSMLKPVDTWIPSGCMALDVALGGGWPVGRLTEIYGTEASAKTLVAAQAVVNAQQMESGCFCVYADSEESVSQDFFAAVGVDEEMLYMLESPDTFNDILIPLQVLIEYKDKTWGPDFPMLFVWDSVAATESKEEKEQKEKDRDWEKRSYSQAALILSNALRDLSTKFNKSNVAALFINQTRTNIGVTFGEKTTTYGGKAIRFHASIRCELKITEKFREQAPGAKHKKVIGQNVDATITKNKITSPYRMAKLQLYFGLGIHNWTSTFETMKHFGIVEHTSAGRYRMDAALEGTFKRDEFEDLMLENYELFYDVLETYASPLSSPTVRKLYGYEED